MTGLLFDKPVIVELQDESRFVEVTRGRRGISFVPPEDMFAEEQLRMTATLQVGDIKQSVTFVLVAHPGQATRQLDVYRDKRTWQSLHDELIQAWSAGEHLKEEIDSLRLQFDQAVGLRGLYIHGWLGPEGIKARTLDLPDAAPVERVSAVQAVSYRGETSVAILAAVRNGTRAPWILRRATLVQAEDSPLEAVRIWQPEPLLPEQQTQVFVEFEVKSLPPGPAILSLEEAGPRGITVPGIIFP